MISVIMAPVSAPQLPVHPLRGVEHPLAPEVLERMRAHGPAPVGLWNLVNGLAASRLPANRAQRRCLCLRYWGAVRTLLAVGLLRRHGGLVAIGDFAARARPMSRSQNSRARVVDGLGVAAVGIQKGGSNLRVPEADTSLERIQTPGAQADAQQTQTAAHTLETQSAEPTAADISAAARQLAQQPRKRRQVTGWLHGRRLRRLTLVVVPGGQVLPATVVRRRYVYVLLPNAPGQTGLRMERYRAQDVRVYRSPAAVLMGGLKAGVRERRSPRKQAAARVNGSRPCAPGRRRGRPRITSN